MPTPKAGQIWTSKGISPPYKWKLIEYDSIGMHWTTLAQDRDGSTWGTGIWLNDQSLSVMVCISDPPDRPYKTRLELIND